MFWDDILVDRPLLDDELIASIATIFGIKPLNVLVLRDIADTSIKISDVHQVVIEKTEIAGDFLTRLCVYLRDEKLEKRAEESGTIPIWKQLCRLLDCRCFVGDDSLDPAAGFVIAPDGKVAAAYLDDEELDRERYVLAPTEMMAR